MEAQKYGQTIDESVAEEMLQARQIVQTVLDFGVSQKQIVQIVKLLGLELENHIDSRAIVAVAKSVQENKASTILT
ncbi:hypothetical protein HN588_07460 [Candidatus Bathyarchaeota archaeon]|jgi:hypothetical protein|nr:hypothetical protein [Candidatus Bathyarchaeota archaeon]